MNSVHVSLPETEGCGAHHQDRGAGRGRPGEGLFRRNRADAGKQDEVSEGEDEGA